MEKQQDRLSSIPKSQRKLGAEEDLGTQPSSQFRWMKSVPRSGQLTGSRWLRTQLHTQTEFSFPSQRQVLLKTGGHGGQKSVPRKERRAVGSSSPYPSALRRTHRQDSVCDEHENAHKDDHGVFVIEASLPRLRFHFLQASIFPTYKHLNRHSLCLSHSL